MLDGQPVKIPVVVLRFYGEAHMKLIRVTPIWGAPKGRAYLIDHAARPCVGADGSRRSSALTFPPVASRILRIIVADGKRWPLIHRLIEAPVTPIEPANSACDILCFKRKSASFMPDHYPDGNGCQAPVTHMGTDNLSACRYLFGMSKLNQLIENDYRSAARIAKKIGVSGKQLSLWRRGKAAIPDDKAIVLANEFDVTPFDISSDFNKVVLDGYRNPRQREAVRAYMEQAWHVMTKLEPLPTPDSKPSRRAGTK
jgi:transcriptional regulator with XRE-family HTH domain